MRRSEIWVTLNGTSVYVSWMKNAPVVVEYGVSLLDRDEVIPVKVFMEHSKNKFTRKVKSWGWVRV